MKALNAIFASVLVFVSSLPVRADFKYTETSQVTGGALVGMMKFASVFARGDAKKQEREALAPTSTTHYVKGGRLRTDDADGTVHIVDLDGRRVIWINMQNKTYSVATFDQIKAAMEQAQQNMQQEMQKNPGQARQMQNTQLTITPKITVTPGTGNRVILDQPTNETKVLIDMEMQATSTDPSVQAAAASSGKPTSGTVDYVMNMDTFVAPSVSGYGEFAEFYRRMAKEVNWMTLPSNIHVDPRVTQGLSQLQKNSDALKGFPLLSYISMTFAAPAGSEQKSAASQQQPSTPPPSNTSSASSSSSIPDSPSAVMKNLNLGGLFGHKKQQTSQESSNAGTPPPNPNSNPNSLIEITSQVSSFSASSLDSSLFDVPAGYTQIQQDPAQILNGPQPPKSQPQK